ncbi:MAG: response regulator [Erysipelotrichia bacterium]|nr:response regulator [Erysipelotrichia bacterium]
MTTENQDLSHLVDGKYGITDLVDLEQLRVIFEQFTAATGYTIGFLDHPALDVLIASGWRDICTKFHRSCPEANDVCLRSNHHLLDQLNEPGAIVIEGCEHGLVDCATPIFVKGKHIASLATGQLLLETPDPERFKHQARKFGFDEEKYLASLAEIPVVDSAQLKNVTRFLGSIAIVLSELGYTHLVLKEKSARLEEEIAVRKKAEEEKEKLQGQLIQAQKMESVGRLAGGVAHDFNNMLGAIIGYVELAQSQNLPQPVVAYVKEIEKAAQRSAELTRQLLTFARKQPITPRSIDVNESVENVLNMLHRLIGEDIDLIWRPGSALWRVKMDSAQLDQILANLCVNARDAIKGVGKVVIETANATFDDAYCATHVGFCPGEYVLLAVSDNGCGMDKETQSHLFEPFFTTKSPGHGTGLGLATAYGVVKQNDGFISVYSEPGAGAVFKIFLPRYTGLVEKTRTSISSENLVCGQETILLVEDEPILLELCEKMLNEIGYKVLSAGSSAAAIKMAKERSGEIQLLLTDLIMPDMSGRELAQHLQSIYPEMKSLFMSGYTANSIGSRGILENGVCFIQKPFSLRDLAIKIREALEKE